MKRIMTSRFNKCNKRKLLSSLMVSTLVVTLLLLTSCTTNNAYTGEKQTSRSTKGAAIGAVGGALVGFLTGDSRNAVIGAALGAGIGGAIGHSQDKQETALRHELQGTGVQVQRNGNDIKLIMPGDITFGIDKSVIKPHFEPVLNSVAIVLKKFKNNYVKVAGYTSNTGTAAHNLKLSQRRAAAVINYLHQQGVAAARLVNIGYGEQNPIANNSTPEGRSANRRVEINIVPINQH